MAFLWQIEWTARLHRSLVALGEAIPDDERVFRFLASPPSGKTTVSRSRAGTSMKGRGFAPFGNGRASTLSASPCRHRYSMSLFQPPAGAVVPGVHPGPGSGRRPGVRRVERLQTSAATIFRSGTP